VQDSTSSFPYWNLTDVDNAGRYKTEAFGNGATSTRSYFPDKQGLQSIITQSGAATVQNLAYDYDARRDLTSRADMLQSQTERFRYDAVKRLTCAYFSSVENDTAPCAVAYGYDPTGNGNLTAKSDVGTLAYTDPNHPHAVTTAGSNAFGYDAVGNQTTRPGGATLTYTPFDLPKTITQPSGNVTLDYDGDEQRIRKTSPTAETLYFADLYERVTTTAPAGVANKYYIHSPERVVAVVTQGAGAATEYIHVDHLGSVDVLTDANGAVAERRSYDAFGQRRNPGWGQPPPASFPSLTDVGFTGQEDDSELGLVNMKGRMYDPQVGRFLTTDPIVSEPLSAQSWNPYSYVRNNPLNRVDPSGFDDGPPPPPGGYQTGVWYGNVCFEPGCGEAPPPKTVEGSKEPVEVGATTRPVDVGTTGTASKEPPQSVTTAPRDWKPSPAVQVAGGVLEGVFNFVVSTSQSFTLNGQGAAAAAMAQGAITGAREGGVIGAAAGLINPLNPFYQVGVVGVDTKTAADKGDYWNVAKGVTTLGIAVAAVFIGGKGAAAEEAATADVAAIRLPEKTGVGFPTFDAFKDAMGSVRPDFDWHHIVEQNGAGGENARVFPPEQIHNTNNLIPVERNTHGDITEFYRKPQDVTPFKGLSPRQWLRGQGWEAQHNFGLGVLKDHGVVP
jgi:RHS repeat-associated protein